jgi:hypothetical protein
MVKKDSKEQIEIFVNRLLKVGRFQDTFYILQDEGILTHNMYFYRDNKKVQKALKDVKKRELKLFTDEAIKRLSLKDAYNHLNSKGLLNYGLSFYSDTIKITDIKKEKKVQEYKLLRDTAMSAGVSLAEAHEMIKDKLVFSYVVLLNAEKQIKDKDFASKQQKQAIIDQATRIVQNYKDTNFEGRIMTKEVEEAYKILKLEL